MGSAQQGIPTLSNLSYKLCRALGKFAPILTVTYASNPALLAALAAAQAACAELNKELRKERDYGD
jgi:hypothetical protein